MMSLLASLRSRAVALAAMMGFCLVVVLPASGTGVAMGVLVAVLTMAVVIAVRAPLGDGVTRHPDARASEARVVPLGSQSDPDARGHARPRAPSILLPAV